MFSIRTNWAATSLMAAVLVASTTSAQPPLTPSQRFSPVRNVPPSVHVPDNSIRSLKSSTPTDQQGTTYNFSDTPSSVFRPPNHPADRPGSTQLVSFDQESTDENQKIGLPEIPAVLRNGSTRANQNDQPIVVDSKGFANHQQDIQETLNELKQLQETVQNQRALVPNHLPVSRPIEQVGFHQQEQTGSADVSSIQSSTHFPPESGAEIQTTEFEMREDRRDSVQTIRGVSAESAMNFDSSLTLTAPAVRVQAFGPDSIGVNKISTYKITVSNEGTVNAENLSVGIGVPDFIHLQNINLTTGHHQLTDGNEWPRLIWRIERLAAGTTHTLAMNFIPQTADTFEMEVQWSLEPQAATTLVQVTQPRLDMRISGPTEVMYGEKATYDVTIANPGTGDAEQVSVMLPEALGGERANIGAVPAGSEKRFKVELFARTAGPLNLTATATAEGNIETTASHDILVRRANLNIAIDGPAMKYAGTIGQYTITIANDGDASAADVLGVLALPTGVKYLGGIDNIMSGEGGLKWNVGTLTAGDRRAFQVNCQMDASGDLLFHVGARGAGDLAATASCQSRVETIADLTLRVEDPKGPLPTGDHISYRLIIGNRGTRSASGVNVVMQFSEGIEPVRADGFKHKIVTGQVVFSPISRIEPGQEMVLNVTAQALKSGAHIFRAQLICEESDSREVAEGTTRFFGDDVATSGELMLTPAKANTADASSDFTPDSSALDFK